MLLQRAPYQILKKRPLKSSRNPFKIYFIYNTIMPLRSGKEYLKSLFAQQGVPFLLILLPEKKYEVAIDFDGAHRAWIENKVKVGQGHYKYK